MSGFDRLARPYRWMEYLSFGRALERCRFHFLPQLADTRSAMLLGDGDGRFAERLLRAMVDRVRVKTSNSVLEFRTVDTSNPRLAAETWLSEPSRVIAVDGSRAMLALLRSRCSFAGDILETHVADLAHGLPAALQHGAFDLVTTHFFLDCLSTEEVNHLIADVKPRMTNDAQWVVSDFAVPARGAMRLPAWIVVRGLYLSFRLLTGLQTQQLPDHRAAMQAHGLILAEECNMLGGLLIAEIWRCEKKADLKG